MARGWLVLGGVESCTEYLWYFFPASRMYAPAEWTEEHKLSQIDSSLDQGELLLPEASTT